MDEGTDRAPLAPDSSTAHMPNPQEQLIAGQIRTLHDAATFLRTLQATEANSQNMVIQPMVEQLGSRVQNVHSGGVAGAPAWEGTPAPSSHGSPSSPRSQTGAPMSNEGPPTLGVWA